LSLFYSGNPADLPKVRFYFVAKRNVKLNNSAYKKLGVQWLNLPTGRQVKLCASYQVFGGRQFSPPKSPTSP